MVRKQKSRKTRAGAAVEKVIKNLVKLTTVPIEKSVIKWQMEKVFGRLLFRSEYKNKIYVFNGRQLAAYPAGYDLPPGESHGGTKSPDILFRADIYVAPKRFADLWMLACGQHEKKLLEEKARQKKQHSEYKKRQKEERKRMVKHVEKCLEDFRRKQDF